MPETLSNSELSAEDRQAVADHTKKIRLLKRDRSELNAEINSERKKIRALGIDLDAWRASERRYEMDPDERSEFDRSYDECNMALGVPAHATQADMFEEDSEDEVRARKDAVVGEPIGGRSDGGGLPASAGAPVSETVQ